MSLKELKAMKASISESLQKLITEETVKKADSPVDGRLFNLVKDASGNGSATIRFLPQKDPSKAPIIKFFRHSLEQKGRWFIEECPTTIGKKCPVCEHSSSIWDDSAGKEQNPGRMWWKKKTYISNVLVVDDPANPENNGKVMIFKFGQQIYDMILKAINPEDPDNQMNIFDFDEGYNFKLTMIQVSGFNNYDRKSAFSLKHSAIAGGDETEQEAIYNQIHDLSEFHQPDQFKEYDDITAKLNRYLGVKGTKATTLEDEMKNEKKEAAKKDKNVVVTDDTDDDDLDFSDLDDDLSDDDIPF